MRQVQELAPAIGIVTACVVLGLVRATYYRCVRPRPSGPRAPRPSPPRALSATQRQQVLEVLNGERFVDQAPAEAYATLLDEGVRHCSVRTMYRVLAAAGEVRERRNQLVHPAYTKPELLATAANQVWTWDITKLRAATKWTYFYLYVLLDLFSRYVVGWMLAHKESGDLAARLVEESCTQQGITRGQLTLHADRGSAPTAKTLAQLLADLGVTRSHSRPYVSDDNPFSEAQFRTLKYQPTYPDRFTNYEQARAHCREFFPWYNHEHRHAGIAMLTPADVHYGRAGDVLASRQRVLDAAYAEHPERFVRGRPQVPALPSAVWINPPEDKKQVTLEASQEGGLS